MKLPNLVYPMKTNILGIGISRTNYEESTNLIISSAKCQQCLTVAAVNVHSITEGYLDSGGHGKVLRNFALVAPDGQPVKWAVNLFRKRGQEPLKDRVRGPQLMLDVCEQAAREGIGIFLYGSKKSVLEKLEESLKEKFPELIISGSVSPPFRNLTEEEEAEYIRKIRASGASIVFVSLGCPKQEAWAFRHRNVLPYPLICVGAAFDFYAGNIPEAPVLMQNLALEWLYRLYKEPKRLFWRYSFYNSLYLILLLLQLIGCLPKRDYGDD